ncbi:uncharacterized protein LOC110457257 [Mizuhopecten yessoensis]|uniref:Zinc finger protein 710 n=1 Tax=Mizuhopecten yessoensis TaxID=6573 RepID=A0A210Q951_MIZYE|nr:uncharacterized protein LOC110457257 [Mizuhopecten yessoensis]OWF45270.1 Zinc finger protein 710 [Mizuhopecten yessoensis]
MDGLGSGYSFGHSDLEFPSPDGQLSGHGGGISNFASSLHLSYPHIQHGGAALRDSGYSTPGLNGRSSHGVNTFHMPRFPMSVAPETAIQAVPGIPAPDFSHIIPRHHLVSPHTPSPSLPHISSFGESVYLSSDRTTVPQTSVSHSDNDHSSFGSIMASAVSNISTMNIPLQPYETQLTGTHTESQVSDLTLPRLRESSTYNSVMTNTSQSQAFLDFPSSTSSETESRNSEAVQAVSSLASFPQPLLPQSFQGQVNSTQPPSSSSYPVVRNMLPEQPVLLPRPTNTQTLPMENLDGDQQVPNAVMSPASGCSSPNIRNPSTQDNRPLSLLHQTSTVTHDSLQLQVAQTDNMATLQNETSFANSTYLGGELCTDDKFVVASEPTKCSSPESFDNQTPKSAANNHDNSVHPVASSSRTETSTCYQPGQRRSPRRSSSRLMDRRSCTKTHTSSDSRTDHLQVSLDQVDLTENDDMKEREQDQSPAKGIKRLEYVGHEKESQEIVSDHRLSVNSTSTVGRNLVSFFKLGKLWRKPRRSRLKVPPPLDLSVSSEEAEDLEEEEEEEEYPYESLAQDQDESLVKEEEQSPGITKEDRDQQQFIRMSQPVFSRNSEQDTQDLTDSHLDRSQQFMDNHVLEGEGKVSRRKTRRSFIYHTEESKAGSADKSNKKPNLSEDYLSKCTEEIVAAAMGDLPLENHEKRRFNTKSNPFAITSPSFGTSAARAVMTTSVANNATVITISIMGKGNAKKGQTKTININKGVIMSTSFQDRPVRNREGVEEEDKSEVGMQTTSIMSRLKREKEDQGGQDDDSDVVETMEVNVRIDDSQLVQHGEHKRWQCHLCEKSYTTKHNLVAHILDHNNIKPHLCMVCGKYFKQLSHLNTHMLTHDNIRPHKCDVCGKGFTQISHLKRHTAVHLDSKPYKCDMCSRGFAYPSELKAHKEKHMQGHDKCDECGMEFESPRALKLHQLKHDNREDLICKYCDKAFRYPSQLKDHLVSHEGMRPFICAECGMDFMKEHHLKAHQFTHTGQRPFDCPKCGRTFNQRANMMRHMLIHNPTRAFRCDVCGKTFTQPQTLKAHRVVHADIKPHKCKICGKQFGRLHNLQGHIHMHNNSKPYVCFCGSSFTLKGNLNRHKKVKHGLSESTESLEEEAVSFLSSLSGRTQVDEVDTFLDYTDFEQDVEQIASTSDLRTPRKGRKSVIPRKILRRRSSANRKENEETDQEDDVEEDDYEEEDEDGEGQGHYAGETVSGIFGDIKKEQDQQCSTANQKSENQQISLRKRKLQNSSAKMEENRAELSSEMSEGQDNEDVSDTEWRPASKQGRTGKGAKLDSIIAQKFKNV